MNIRRLVLDVDKSFARPSIIDIAESIANVAGVHGFNITVNEIDMETVGMIITIEGDGIDHKALIAQIEHTGAMVHAIDQLVAGDRLVEFVDRQR